MPKRRTPRTCEQCHTPGEVGNRVGSRSGLCRRCKELYSESELDNRRYLRRKREQRAERRAA
jgi:hypothetical protein